MNELKKYDKIFDDISSFTIGRYLAVFDEVLKESEMDNCMEKVRKQLEKKYANKSTLCSNIIKEAYFHLQMFIANLMIIGIISETLGKKYVLYDEDRWLWGFFMNGLKRGEQ